MDGNPFYISMAGSREVIIMNPTENNKEAKSYVVFVIYAVPKKNNESMLQVVNKSIDMFRR